SKQGQLGSHSVLDRDDLSRNIIHSRQLSRRSRHANCCGLSFCGRQRKVSLQRDKSITFLVESSPLRFLLDLNTLVQ
ncbi:hypothetical protein B0H11DRAFT_1853049, partial [Mycena galericulata]